MTLRMRNKKKQVPLTGTLGVMCILCVGLLVLEYKHFAVLKEVKDLVESVVWCNGENGIPFGSQGTKRVYSGALGWWDEVGPSTKDCPVGAKGDSIPTGHMRLPSPEVTKGKPVAFYVLEGASLQISGRHEMSDRVFGLITVPDASIALTRKAQVCRDGQWTALQTGPFATHTFYPKQIIVGYYHIWGPGLRRVISKGQMIQSPGYDLSLAASDKGFTLHSDGWLYDGDATCREGATRVSHWYHEVEVPFTVLARHEGSGSLAQIEYSDDNLFKARRGVLSLSQVLQDSVHRMGRVSLVLRCTCVLSAAVCLAIAGLSSVTSFFVSILVASATMSSTDYVLWGVFHMPTTLALSLPSLTLITLDFLFTWYFCTKRSPKGQHPRSQQPQPQPRFKEKMN